MPKKAQPAKERLILRSYASPAEMKLIDRAVASRRKNTYNISRSAFLLQSALEAARAELLSPRGRQTSF